jgi:hypothetical protein
MTNRQFALVGGAPWRMALGRSSADCRPRSNCSPHSSAFLLSSRNLYWLKTSSMVRWMVLRSVGEAGPREPQFEAECPRVVKYCERSRVAIGQAPDPILLQNREAVVRNHFIVAVELILQVGGGAGFALLFSLLSAVICHCRDVDVRRRRNREPKKQLSCVRPDIRI